MNVDFTKIRTSNFADKNFICDCGQSHKVATQRIVIGENALMLLGELAQSVVPVGKALLISCEDIFQPYGNKVINRLVGAGYAVIKHIFKGNILPDIKYCNILNALPEDIKLVICFGGGTVCDIAKYFCYMRGIKLIMIPSAPAVFGHLSNYSALFQDGIKRYIPSMPPNILLCDLTALCGATQEMIAAAFGQLCSMLTVLFDLYYAKVIFGGHYCENIADMLFQVIDMGINEGEGLKAKQSSSIYILTEAILRCSLCIQMLQDGNVIGSPYYAADIFSFNNKNFLYGESVFIMHQKIFSLYKLFLENDLSGDILLPSDKAVHARRLSEIFGIDYYKTLPKIKYDLGVKTYMVTKYKIEEYRDDLLRFLNDIGQRVEKAAMVYKRIYQDAGYLFNQKLKNADTAQAIALACDFNDLPCLLSYMKNGGLFEKYI
ncbi:MAG: iron-containing alcohol dehydrogenase [Clostridia bacterium]|nr:iron-containing alcohol dehydrogenase [Clostridia bacterium]